MGIARYVATAWQQPDRGIWEMRGPGALVHRIEGRRPGPRSIERFDTPKSTALDGPSTTLREARKAIFDEVCREGFNTELNTFTQYYGGTGWTRASSSSR